MLWIVYRTGYNAANNSAIGGGPATVAVAKVEADSEGAACDLAMGRVSVYNGQYLSARLASKVEAEEAEADRRVEVL